MDRNDVVLMNFHKKIFIYHFFSFRFVQTIDWNNVLFKSPQEDLHLYSFTFSFRFVQTIDQNDVAIKNIDVKLNKDFKNVTNIF